MQDSVFTKIIKGELPSHKIYEDNRTVAFLDIHPTVEGFALVVPKTQVDALWDLEDVDYQAVLSTVRKVAKKLRDVLGVPRVGVKVEGLEVPHAHVKMIPFTTAEEFNRHVPMDPAPDQEALAALAGRLKL
jgi:histidine triad (HIT) family protein